MQCLQTERQKKLKDGYDLTNNYVRNNLENGSLLYASKTKAPIWFTSRGLQLPKLVQTIIDADNSISQEPQNVNAV